MCNKEYFTNRPIYKLDKENDLLGNSEKVNFITSFLIENKDYIRKNNMLALFGNWGSGKTTLIYAIKENIEKDKYFPIIFDAWKYEKDGNLAFSLYEFLLDNISSDKNNLETAKRIGKAALIGAIKSINIVEKIAVEVEKEIGKEERTDSLYRKVSEFEKNFNEIIEEFYKKDNKCLLVFIDDLDRCDPENILNLLSSIKLLLNFEKKDLLDQNESKVIYFCVIDKDAVAKAANIQFHDKIKAEEYLEKIFDISFNMPKRYKTENIVKKYFKNNSSHIAEFLNYINFYNPRHLKKVLNKYRVLSLIKENKSSEFFEYIPNIIVDEKGYIFDTIMVLYFIILYEFYPDKFYEIRNYGEKISNYIDYLIGDRQSGTALVNKKNRIDSNIIIYDKNLFLLFKHISVSKFINRNEGEDNKRKLFQFLNFFTPKIFTKFEINMNDLAYFDQFKYQGNEILIDFCKYLFDNIEQITMKDREREYMRDYNLIKLFNMAEMLL